MVAPKSKDEKSDYEEEQDDGRTQSETEMMCNQAENDDDASPM